VHASRRPRNELAAHLRFEGLDLPAERRLRHVQAFGRAPEVLLLREGDEVSKMPHLHDEYLKTDTYEVPRDEPRRYWTRRAAAT
jgi:hypothetical protein